MNALIILNEKVFVNPNFDDLDLNSIGLKFWDVTTSKQSSQATDQGNSS